MIGEMGFAVEDGVLTIKMSQKSPGIVSMLEELTGRTRDGKQCAICGATKVAPADFRDELSCREFSISMMCQECQDSVWSEGDNK